MSNSQGLSRILTLSLAYLAMTGPIATDMYLASFTMIASDLNTTASLVQITLTTFLLGLGIGQLFLGPLSDRLGRRPVLIASLSVFVVASILAIFTPNIYIFIILRAIQGLSGAAAVVLARAIAADLTRGAETVRALSFIAMLIGLGPILAPPIGALVGSFFGWRGVLTALALFGMGMLLTAIFLIPESLPKQQRQRGGIKTSLQNFHSLLAAPKFRLLLIAYATIFAAMMAYISASPFVGQTVLGMSQMQYALAFAVGASALISANMLNAKLARKIEAIRMLKFGITLSLIFALLLLAQTLTSTLTWWSFILTIFFMIAGIAFTMSNSSALALMLANRARGSGAALLGSSQFILGGLVSPLVGAWGETNPVPMAVTVTVAICISFVATLAYGRRIKSA